jgi:DNA-binding response OmpR family regulator
VVEDDPDVLEIAVDAIRSFGFEVLSATNAAAAIKILQRNRSVELLFTDVMMPPGKNGVELAQDARRLRPTLSVLLASGYPRDALQASKVVSDDMPFIAKPYSMSSLRGQLEGLRRGAPHSVTVATETSAFNEIQLVH